MESRSRIPHIEERRLSNRLDDLAERIKALPADRNQELQAMLQREFYSAQEVATLLNVSVETIRRAIRDKRLPAFRLAKGASPYRIKVEDLQRFIDQQRQSATLEHTP